MQTGYGNLESHLIRMSMGSNNMNKNNKTYTSEYYEFNNQDTNNTEIELLLNINSKISSWTQQNNDLHQNTSNCYFTLITLPLITL